MTRLMTEETEQFIQHLLGATPAAARLRQRFRSDLKRAREQVLADAEGFEAIVHVIERLGRYLVSSGTGLGMYEDALCALVRGAHLDLDRLPERLFLLRQIRNDHAHQGFHARNAAREAVHVALSLEDALAGGWGDVELRDLMTPEPVVDRRDEGVMVVG